MWNPYGITIDNLGNIYTTAGGGVIKITPNGITDLVGNQAFGSIFTDNMVTIVVPDLTAPVVSLNGS